MGSETGFHLKQSMQNPSERSRFRRRLLAWFDKNQRDLPWRQRKSLYRIWVSEVMLQQTQVVTVIDYFNRFIKRFPSVNELAAADESEVLKLWEGLGYYRRARQMHAASKQIVVDHGGKFPQTFDQVLALPGIGRYTAGAILSIGGNQPYPVLEGNTVRVYSRLLNLHQDVGTSHAQKSLWEFAESLITKSRPGDLNQALMELGSEICVVKSPGCNECPVNRHCLAVQHGDPARLPNKGDRITRYESLHQVALVVRRGQRVAIRLCGPDEHWTGLWDFPRFSVQSSDLQKEIVLQTKQQTGLTVRVGKPFRQLKHAVTRFRITLDCYEAGQVTGRLRTSKSLRWATINELDDLPMSATGREIAKHLVTSV